MAEEIHLQWMKSLRDEIPLRGEKDAADLISSEAESRRFHPSVSSDFIVAMPRFHFIFVISNSPITQKKELHSQCFFQLNPPMAEEIHLQWMKSLRDEIPLRGEKDAADLISSEAESRRFHPSFGSDFIVAMPRFHLYFVISNRPTKQIFISQSLAKLLNICYN